MKKFPSKLFHMRNLAVAGLALTASFTHGAVLTVASSFDAGAGTNINGIAYQVVGGVGTVYAADTAGAGAYRAYNASTGESLLNLSSGGSYTYAAAVGIGDNNPEYYISTADGRTLRYNPATPAFVTTFFAPTAILGEESANPYAGYSNFWAVQADGIHLLLLNYETVQTALQTIATAATNLTDLAVGLDGSLYALGGNSIYQYSTAGTLMTTYEVDPTIVNPIGIAFNTTTNSFLITNSSSTVYTLQAIPEPSTVALVLSGVGMAICVSRRKRSSK